MPQSRPPTTQASTAEMLAEPDLADNIASFGRHLRAANVSPRTATLYMDAARRLAGCIR